MDKDPVDTTSPAAIPDISGRELNVIFTEIARQKGHKIMVILDCCFSAGATKALQPVHRVRARPAQATILNSTESSLELMLKAGDDNLRRVFPDYATSDGADWQQDVTSHVLLAACQDYQQAHEGQIGNVCRGLFTNSLICSLRLDMPGKGVSFVNFVKNLPRWANQEPVVSGDHKHEPIFYIT